MTDKERSKPGQYILKRIGQTILIWFLIVVVNFFIFRIMPGDPRGSLISEHMPPEVRQAIAERFGLDLPLFDQFVIYIINIFRGDFGESFSHFGEDV
ncbi:MAG: ABC transporter permease, partial [Candidatus Odinarchaeota archaeon]